MPSRGTPNGLSCCARADHHTTSSPCLHIKPRPCRATRGVLSAYLSSAGIDFGRKDPISHLPLDHLAFFAQMHSNCGITKYTPVWCSVVLPGVWSSLWVRYPTPVERPTLIWTMNITIFTSPLHQLETQYYCSIIVLLDTQIRY